MSDIQRIHTSPRMSKIVKSGNLIFLCGQTSLGSSAVTIEEQTRETLRRVTELLREAGSDHDKMLSACIHLKNMSDFASMNLVWDAWLPEGAAPARTTVEASLAAPNLLVEVTVIATT